MPETATITTELLMRFCDEGWDKFATPWFDGGFIYATDGRIGIRLDVSVHNPQYETGSGAVKRPGVATVLAPAGRVNSWQPYPVFQKCPACGGLGETKRDCHTCRGRGEHECPCCDDLHDCGHCEGSGKLVGDCGCDEKVGNRLLKGRYAYLIGDLPSPEWGTISENPIDELFFRGPGYLGVVMPLVGPGER